VTQCYVTTPIPVAVRLQRFVVGVAGSDQVTAQTFVFCFHCVLCS